MENRKRDLVEILQFVVPLTIAVVALVFTISIIIKHPRTVSVAEIKKANIACADHGGVRSYTFVKDELTSCECNNSKVAKVIKL